MKRLFMSDDLRQWRPAVAGTAAILLSIAFATLFLWKWPSTYIVDDGGIVVKYMDSFAAGGFYKYNMQDNPVFGISGFIHGILAGGLSATHLFSPENSVIVSNYLGVCLTSLAILLILRVFSHSCSMVVLGWATTLTASTYFVRTAFQGLETPLHLGIVLLAYWAFLSERGKAMWLLGAMAIISKLDAVPVIVVLGIFRLLQAFNRTHSLKSMQKELRDALIWSGIPLAGWVLLACSVFGSPLPHTAYAKLYFISHPAGKFTFISDWWTIESLGIALPLGICVTFAACCLLLKRKDLAIKCSVFVTGCIGVTLLFCAFNPEERMIWYYVLPQTSLILGAVAALISIPNLVSKNKFNALRFAVCMVLLVLLPFSANSAKRWALATSSWISSIEPERIAVGKWIRSAAAPTDRLFAGHGHIARYAHLYTYDYTGLNSPIITDLLRQGKDPLHELQPEWITWPGLLPIEQQKDLGYELVASFYGISLAGWPAWRVWRKGEHDPASPLCQAQQLSPENVRTDGEIKDNEMHLLHILGSNITLASPVTGAIPKAIFFGIAKRPQPFTFTVSLNSSDSEQAHRNLESIFVPALNPKDLANGRTLSCQVKIPNGNQLSQAHIHLSQGSSGLKVEPFLILEPVWVMRPALVEQPVNH